MIGEKPQTESIIQVAHDIRSPLFALRAILATPDPLNHRGLLQSVSRRLQEIADSIIISRELPSPGTIKLLPYIVEVLEEKGFIYPEIQFSLDGPKNAEAQIAPQVLQRIISNLVNNAIHACRGKKGVISVVVTSYKRATQITVRDNGVGMKRDELKSAFNKGLGLSWAQQTLREIGGSIQLSSSSMGTVVTIVIY